MRPLRTCDSAQLNTGVSKCPLDLGKMKGAILVDAGTKLPAELTADKLEQLAHADEGSRIHGIVDFVEAAKNGGEAQTSVTGYGAEKFNGFSARKDTFTLDAFHPELMASIIRSANVERGAYFFDENGVLYGTNDGTDMLAPFEMACIYSDATPFPTSSERATMNVTFCFKNVKKAIVNYDFVVTGIDFSRLTLGLLEVVLAKGSDNKYKLYEKVGGNDVTGIYGPLIAEAGADVFNGSATAVSYSDKMLTITATGDISLKSPKDLYAKDIKGIIAVEA